MAEKDPMQGRISRFAEIRQQGVHVPFIDSILPGHIRTVYPVIGDAASEDDAYTSRITDPHRFGLAFLESAPGNGPAWHTHDYCELFVPLTGTWRFFYGYDGEDPDALAGEAVIGPWDVISFPAGLWRRFHNESEVNAWALAVLDPHEPFAGKDPHWPQWLVEQAERDYGLASDASGRLIKPEHFADLEQQVRDHMAKAPSPTT